MLELYENISLFQVQVGFLLLFHEMFHRICTEISKGTQEIGKIEDEKMNSKSAIDMEWKQLTNEALIMDYSRRLKMKMKEELRGNKVQIMIMNQLIDETEKEMIK